MINLFATIGALTTLAVGGAVSWYTLRQHQDRRRIEKYARDNAEREAVFRRETAAVTGRKWFYLADLQEVERVGKVMGFLPFAQCLSTPEYSYRSHVDCYYFARIHGCTCTGEAQSYGCPARSLCVWVAVYSPQARKERNKPPRTE